VDPLSYFDEHDHAEMNLAPYAHNPYPALLVVALRVLERMPPGASMVCGPISTGGFGSIEKNLARFTRAIDLLASRGENVFTQMPFAEPMKCVQGESLPYASGIHLLEEFFLPIFQSGRVTRLCFLPSWQSSFGTRWEHEQAWRLGLARKYFRKDYEILPPHVPLLID
jgi:hypothetical protein